MNQQITQILSRISDGQQHAVDELVPLVYDQMRQLATSALQREPEAGCDPTELVHEAYIKLIGNEQLAWESRSHFYGACAVVIRRILVDQARARNRLKRGGGIKRVALDEDHPASPDSSVDMIALDEALRELEQMSPRQARLVELRFFGGLTETEAAEVLKVSRRTLAGDWVMVKAWLKIQLD